MIVEMFSDLNISTSIVPTRYRLSSDSPPASASAPPGSISPPATEDTKSRRPFEVNSTTGELYVSGPIDYEREAVYRLTVVATDLGPDSLPTFATVTLYVLDINDNAPRIAVNVMTPYRYAQVAITRGLVGSLPFNSWP